MGADSEIGAPSTVSGLMARHVSIGADSETGVPGAGFFARRRLPRHGG
jgi:hypothetical protein